METSKPLGLTPSTASLAQDGKATTTVSKEFIATNYRLTYENNYFTTSMAPHNSTVQAKPEVTSGVTISNILCHREGDKFKKVTEIRLGDKVIVLEDTYNFTNIKKPTETHANLLLTDVLQNNQDQSLPNHLDSIFKPSDSFSTPLANKNELTNSNIAPASTFSNSLSPQKQAGQSKGLQLQKVDNPNPSSKPKQSNSYVKHTQRSQESYESYEPQSHSFAEGASAGQHRRKDKKNIVKNIIKSFAAWLKHQTHVFNTPPGTFEGKQILETLLKDSRYNNHLVLRIVQDPKIGQLFESFLNVQARTWLEESKINDKKSHLEAIQLYMRVCSSGKTDLLRVLKRS